MRKVLLLFFLLFSLIASAESNVIKQFLSDFTAIGGKVIMLEEYGDQYVRVQLNDSTTMEVFECPANLCDNMFVVTTICAPHCSSCARVYNLLGEYLFPLEPPFTSVFPLATIDKETGRIEWKDNDNWEY